MKKRIKSEVKKVTFALNKLNEMLNYIIWDWNPEIISIGFLKIRYYGLFFAGGFAIGYYILKRIFLKEGTKLEWLDSLLMYVLAGTVLGARLGHCLFYEPDYYLSHPLEIIKVWKGGLASHGGAFGILIALWIYSRKVTKKPILWSLDRLLIVVALVGCLIRLGNLANSEIYGRPTESDFGFVHVHDSYFGRYIGDESIARYLDDYKFTKREAINDKQQADITVEFNRYVKTEKDARTIGEFRIKPLLQYRESTDGNVPNLYIEKNSTIQYAEKGGHFIATIPITVIPKHPTHLYEATCYLLTFFFLMFVYSHGGLKRRGLIFGLFVVCVFGSRFFIEIIKENQVASEVNMLLNKGQKLSIPFVLAGIIAIINAYLPKKKKEIDQ